VEYFIMRPDPDVKNGFKMLNWASTIKKINQPKNLIMSKEKVRVMYVADDIYNEYPDFIERPFNLIGDKLKRVMGLYQPNIYFETVVMVEHQRRRQTVYHLMIVPEVDCASDLSVRYFGKIHDLVLDVKKMGDQRIFRVEGDPRLIVRLDVVESILRRVPHGIVFEAVKLELEKKEGVKDGRGVPVYSSRSENGL